MKKKKILVISDHALSPSGVGVQTRFLIEGLLKKGDMSFIQLGAAVKHQDYRTIAVNEDFIIKPIDGFGNPDMLRAILLNEKPDALFIFTDPRFFTWLFEIEDEIHQVCPILWWHVWDNRPTPRFNDWMYDATDAINCHSYLTYEMCSENYPEKTSFIPHAIPPHIMHRLPEDMIAAEKERILGTSRKNSFVCMWMNRNCKRKRPADVLQSWKLFLDRFEDKSDKLLLMHTDPSDNAGHNLIEVALMLGIQDNISFSTEKLDFKFINILHNISDVTLNISFNEGFGLTTLESMQAGTPIISIKTGGLTRQVVDHRDGSENGYALDPDITVLNGSQNIPYISEDYVSCEKVADAIYKYYNLSPEDKKSLSLKVEKYALEEFSYQKTVDLWHESFLETIENHKNNKKEVRLIKVC